MKTSYQKFKKLLLSPVTILLVLSFFIGLFFRFYQLGSIPHGLYWDEVAMLADAKNIANTGRDLHGDHWLQAMFISYGDYKLPVYIWLASLMVKIFSASELVLRLPSVIAGILTIIIQFFIAKKLFSPEKTFKQLSVNFYLILLPLLLSPWAIIFSRTAFEGHVGQFFLSAAVLFLLRSKEKSICLVPAQLFAAVATYTYFSVRFVWPVIMVTYWLFFVFKKENYLKISHKFIIKLILPLFAFILLLLPLFFSPHYQASNQFRLSTKSVLNAQDWALRSNILREQAGNSLISRVFYHRHWLMIRQLLQNYAANLDLDFLFIAGDSNYRHGTGQNGLFSLVFSPFLIWGLYQLWQNKRKNLIFLIAWWLAALLPASVPMEVPHALRSLNALMPISLIIGFGFFRAWSKLQKKIQLLVICLIFISTVHFGFTYFVTYPQYSAQDWQTGFKQLALDACESQKRYDEIWIDVTDDRFFLWLLAYCHPDQNTVAAFQTNPYLQKFDNINLNPDLQNLTRNTSKIMIITEKDDFSDSQVKSIKTFTPYTGKTYTYLSDEK